MKISNQICITMISGLLIGGLLVWGICFVSNILSYRRFLKECEKMWTACMSISTDYVQQDNSSEVPENIVKQLDIIYQTAIEKATGICNMTRGINKQEQLETLKKYAIPFTEFREQYQNQSIVSYLKDLYSFLYYFGRVMASTSGNAYNCKRNMELSNDTILLFYLKNLIDQLEHRTNPETGMYM